MVSHRKPLLLTVLFALVFGGASGYSYVMRKRPAEAGNATPEVKSLLLPVSAALPAEQVLPAVPDPVPQWIAEVASENPVTRAAAIAALAGAPVVQAMPVLQQVMDAGDPADRPLALGSLRELALKGGDADGVIRAALRHEVYDGGDEVIARGAQVTLAEIEDRVGELRQPVVSGSRGEPSLLN